MNGWILAGFLITFGLSLGWLIALVYTKRK